MKHPYLFPLTLLLILTSLLVSCVPDGGEDDKGTSVPGTSVPTTDGTTASTEPGTAAGTDAA